MVLVFNPKIVVEVLMDSYHGVDASWPLCDVNDRKGPGVVCVNDEKIVALGFGFHVSW